MRPDYQEFRKLAKDYARVPVVETVLADMQTPVSAFLSIASDEREAFLLESVENGEQLGRYTFMGLRPYMTLTATGDRIGIRRGRRETEIRGNAFEVLGKMLAQEKAAPVPGLPPFAGGAVGYIAYDMVRQLERLPRIAKDDLRVPDSVLMFFDQVLAFDHVRRQIQVVILSDVSQRNTQEAYGLAVKRLERVLRQLRRNRPNSEPVKPAGTAKIRPLTSPADYIASVRRVKQYIAAGDVFQTVLSQRWTVNPGVPPFQVYRALRTINPSPYMYFLRFGDMHILGSSPEMLIRVNGKNLEYRPIAGTRPRTGNEAGDLRVEAELRADEKEIAEHVMLVDLGRNDVGRVSEYGSVQVRNLMFVERYSHVMHMVSLIAARLKEGCSAVEALAACFPAGTLSGAPKVRAMEIIEELEPVRRGVYGGAVLYADSSGNLDSCIAIRTMVMKGKKGYIQAGAGIVADSHPQKEQEECWNKAQALVRAVEMARRIE